MRNETALIKNTAAAVSSAVLSRAGIKQYDRCVALAIN